MRFFFTFFILINAFFIDEIMAKKPFHHLEDGTFRNPEGSPKRDPNIKWSYKIFNEEKSKIKIDLIKFLLKIQFSKLKMH